MPEPAPGPAGASACSDGSVRLAFSTLGCPQADLDGVLALAGRGFAGVELRSGPDQLVGPHLGHARRAAVARCLSDAGVHVLSVASYVKVGRPDTDDAGVLAAGRAELDLAADLGAAHLRVFPGVAHVAGWSSADGGAAEARAAHRLAALAEAARGSEVVVALETHDSHPRAADVRRLVDAPGCEDVRVVWDALHPWRAGEQPAETFDRLAGRLAYVQVKDVAARDDLAPLALGAGRLPLADVARVLRAGGYDGWVSWEHEAAWFPASPDLAAVVAAGTTWLRQHLPVAGPEVRRADSSE